MSEDEQKGASSPLIPSSFVQLGASGTQHEAAADALMTSDATKTFLDACIAGYLDARVAWERANELEQKAAAQLAETGRPPKNATPQYVLLVAFPKIDDAPALFDDIRTKLERAEQEAAKVVLEARVNMRKQQVAHYKSKMQGDKLVSTKTDEFVKSVLTPFADDWDNTFASASSAKFPRLKVQKWFADELNARIGKAFSDNHQRRARQEQLKREQEEAELKAQAEVLAGAHSGESLQRLADRSARKAVTEEIKLQLQQQGAQHKPSSDGATQDQDPPASAPKAPTNDQRSERVNPKQPQPTHQRAQGQGQRGGKTKFDNKDARRPPAQRDHNQRQGNQRQGPARFRKRQLDNVARSRSRSPRHQTPLPTRAEHKGNGRQDAHEHSRSRSRSPPRSGHARDGDNFRGERRRDSRSRSRDRNPVRGYAETRRSRSRSRGREQGYSGNAKRSRSRSADRRAGAPREPPPKNGAGGDKHSGLQRQQRSSSPRYQRDNRGREGSSHEHKAEQRPSNRR